MKLSTATRKRIKKLLKENKLTLWQFYQRTGIAPSTLSSFMNSKRELISLKTLQKICEGFNISLKEFFDDSLFDHLEE